MFNKLILVFSLLATPAFAELSNCKSLHAVYHSMRTADGLIALPPSIGGAVAEFLWTDKSESVIYGLIFSVPEFDLKLKAPAKATKTTKGIINDRRFNVTYFKVDLTKRVKANK